MTHTKQKIAVRTAAALTMVLAILVTVSFSGCQLTSLLPNHNDGQANMSTTTQPLADDQPAPEIRIPDYLHPLTGTETTQALSAARPVSICIGNTAYALPQYGLSASDILVEVPVEGGISRLMLITNNYEQIGKFGSVRSTRKSLATIANCFDAIQLFAGTSDEGDSVTLPYDTMDYIMQNLPNVYYREASKNAPHNLMTSGALISGGIDSFGYRKTLSEDFALPFSFVEYGKIISPTDGAALSVRTVYSTAQTMEFTYNTKTGMYDRYQFGEQQIDGNTGDGIAFKNVFILYADTVTHESTSGTTLDLSLEKGGSGVWCSQGNQQTITWTITEDGQFVFYDANGQPLIVNRGTSYIGFVKSSQKNNVTIQ